MEDSYNNFSLRSSSDASPVAVNAKMPKRSLVSSASVSSTARSLPITLKSNNRKALPAGHAALFVAKVAALEAVRRFSKAKCSFLWSGLQALQVLCVTPVKWIQKWSPLKNLINGVQTLSRPLLVLSIATALFDISESQNVDSNARDDSHVDDRQASSELHEESQSLQDIPIERIPSEASEILSTKNWLHQLQAELKIQGISLPERLNEDELHRFFIASNGDFPFFLSSIKKTIRWRETYNILQVEELEEWSNMVYWHGVDMEHRPCLIIRLGLACRSLSSHERPRFIQVIVSQVEYGILHLVDPEHPRITVLLDCEDLTPLRFPMQMVRVCSSLLQDHFPNRLSYLFIIRLPPVARVVAQTFFKVLKPVTRQKLKIEGQMYKKVLMQYIPTLPTYLGGNCLCKRCSSTGFSDQQQLHRVSGEISGMERDRDVHDLPDQDLQSGNYNDMNNDMFENRNCDQVLRTAIIGILVICILFAFIAGIYDPLSSPFFST